MFSKRSSGLRMAVPMHELSKNVLRGSSRNAATEIFHDRTRILKFGVALGLSLGIVCAVRPGLVKPAEAKAEEATEEGLSFTPRDTRIRSTLSKNAFLIPYIPQPKSALYCWGDNEGLTVPNCSDIQAPYPLAVPHFDSIGVKDVSFGSKHAAAISKKGDVYGWGMLYEQPGATKSEPRVVVKGGNVIDVVCSAKALFCLSSGGHIYRVDCSPEAVESPQSVGYISGGTTIPQPESLSWRERIVKISGSKGHLMAITNFGSMYSMVHDSTGNSLGQLGIGHSEAVEAGVWYRVNLPFEDSIVDVACGNDHTLALTRANNVLTFGSNSLLQLGQGEYQMGQVSFNTMPTQINTPWAPNSRPRSSKVTKIAAGGDSSSVVLESITEGVALKTFGAGLYGTLGNGLYRHAAGIPVRVKLVSGLTQYDEATAKSTPITIQDVHMGDGTLCVRLDTDDTFVNGANLKHQLGDGSIINRSKPVLMLSRNDDRGYMQLPVKGEDTKITFSSGNGAVFRK
eukprot:CFRG6978T1